MKTLNPAVKQACIELLGDHYDLKVQMRRAPSGGVIFGKVAPIRQTLSEAGFAYEVDEGVWRELPEELRAATPEEIETLIVLSRHQRATARYSGGSTNYAIAWDVTVIDKGKDGTEPVILEERSFRGDTPSAPLLQSHGNVYGSDPRDEVIELVRGLRITRRE